MLVFRTSFTDQKNKTHALVGFGVEGDRYKSVTFGASKCNMILEAMATHGIGHVLAEMVAIAGTYVKPATLAGLAGQYSGDIPVVATVPATVETSTQTAPPEDLPL